MPAIRRPTSEFFATPARKRRPLKLLILGEGGAGKTYTALKLAAHFGTPWAALLTGPDVDRFYDYRHHPKVPNGGWDSWVSVKALENNFATGLFTQAVTEAATAKFAGIIIDQLSMNWSGPGGILDVVEELNDTSNKFAVGWTARGGGNEQFHKLCHSFWTCPINLIVALRSKTKFRPRRNDRGDIEVERMENELAHRDGAESIRPIFDFILLMDDDHNGTFLKPNGEAWPDFNGLHQRPGEKVANLLKKAMAQ